MNITVGVLALQGAFNEHIQLLRQAAHTLSTKNSSLSHDSWTFLEVRTRAELDRCDALIIPGGESTAISLVAQRSNLLEPLREFVKVFRKPTWGTCAGLILLAESANRTKKGGQELIGGLDVRVNRNHFGRQIESFQASLELPFLSSSPSQAPLISSQSSSSPLISPSSTANQDSYTNTDKAPFKAIFIRAPIVEKLLPIIENGIQDSEAKIEDIIVAPSRALGRGVDQKFKGAPVEILGTLPGRTRGLSALQSEVKEMTVEEEDGKVSSEAGDIIAVRQGNVFGTSFHPELTGDSRIHVWWLEQVVKAVYEAATSVRPGGAM